MWHHFFPFFQEEPFVPFVVLFFFSPNWKNFNSENEPPPPALFPYMDLSRLHTSLDYLSQLGKDIFVVIQ
jgi:hypothetical protein